MDVETVKGFAPCTTERANSPRLCAAESSFAGHGSALQSEPLERCWARARVEYEQGLFEDAVRSCRSLLDSQPAHLEARVTLGHALQRLQRWAEAEEEYRKATELDPQCGVARIGCGVCLLRLDRPGEALVEFDQLLTHEPGHAAALLGKATALQLLGLVDTARNLLQAVVREHPDLTTGVAGWAADPSCAGHGVAPVSVALSLTDIEHLADSAFSRGDFAAAAELCRDILRHQPAYAEAWLNLAVALVRSGEVDGADEAIRHLLRIEPDRAEAHLLAGLILQAREQHRAAALSYECALGIRPDMEEALWNLALLREQFGEFDQARQLYETLAAGGSGNEDLWFRLGTVRFKLGDYAASAEAFEFCLRGERLSAPAAYNAGLAYWRARDLVRAKSAFDLALEIQPDCSMTVAAAASIALESADEDRAFELHKRLVTTA